MYAQLEFANIQTTMHRAVMDLYVLMISAMAVVVSQLLKTVMIVMNVLMIAVKNHLETAYMIISVHV